MHPPTSREPHTRAHTRTHTHRSRALRKANADLTLYLEQALNELRFFRERVHLPEGLRGYESLYELAAGRRRRKEKAEGAGEGGGGPHLKR
jgi:hypothetical protein